MFYARQTKAEETDRKTEKGGRDRDRQTDRQRKMGETERQTEKGGRGRQRKAGETERQRKAGKADRERRERQTDRERREGQTEKGGRDRDSQTGKGGRYRQRDRLRKATSPPVAEENFPVVQFRSPGQLTPACLAHSARYAPVRVALLGVDLVHVHLPRRLAQPH